MEVLHILITHSAIPAVSWNNGKEVPRWGVAEIQKMSPSTTNRLFIFEIQVRKTILDVQMWSKE